MLYLLPAWKEYSATVVQILKTSPLVLPFIVGFNANNFSIRTSDVHGEMYKSERERKGDQVNILQVEQSEANAR